MSARRRLTTLEDQLTPAQHILAWVSEVRQHATLDDYVRSVLDLGVPLAAILERVTRSAGAASIGGAPERSQRERSRWTRRDEAAADAERDRAAVRRSVRDTVFLYALVLELNTAAKEAALRTALGASLSLLSHRQLSGCLLQHADPAIADPGEDRVRDTVWPDWLAGAQAVVRFAGVEAAARDSIEGRYFAGQDVLFAESAELDHDATDLVEDLASLVDSDGRRRRARSRRRGAAATHPPEPDSEFETLVTARVVGLTDVARIEALKMLGEDDRALAVAEALLRIPTEPPVADKHPNPPAAGR